MFCILKIEKMENLDLYKNSSDVFSHALKYNKEVYKVHFFHNQKGSGYSIFTIDPLFIEEVDFALGKLAEFSLPEV